jgi:1-acyl-sn-glycerol-3-phosphate acyltransferase
MFGIWSFMHYVLTPIRFILFLIVLYSFIQIIGVLSNQTAIESMILIGCKIFMYLLSINIHISEEDLQRYMLLLYSDRKFLVVFNHTTFVDGFIILSTFPRSCFLMLKTHMFNIIGYNQKFHENTKGIFVGKGETTSKIIEKVENRRVGDYALFVAPGSGNTSSIPDNITEFRGSGAFAGKFPVLPIIIRYEDESLNHNFDNGESMIHSCLKLFLLNNYKIHIKVGDVIEPIDKENIEEYKSRVYTFMNDEYHSMKDI